MKRRIALLAGLAVILASLMPGPAQARRGEEEIQMVNGSIALFTRFTDGEQGFPGVARRLYQHAHQTNGIAGFVFAIDPATFMGRFELTVTDDGLMDDADLGIYLYSDLGDGANAAATTTAEYDVRRPGGETGFIPPGTTHGIVFMSRGLNVTFSYKGFSAMSAEVSEAGFAPAEVTVGSGGWVVWENVGQDFHSVSANNGSFDSSPTLKKPLIPGATFAVQFTEVGDVAYRDKFGTATGVVHVVQGPGPGTPAG